MKIFLIIIALILLIIIAVLCYLNAFRKIEIVEKDMGPYTIVYDEFFGPYKDTPVVANKIYEDLKADGVETFKGFGLYYDDPKKVDAAKLRSEVGSILELKDHVKIDELKKKYKIKEIPSQHAMVAEFPIKNQLSYMVGVIKFYSTVRKYIITQGYQETQDPALEIYDIPNKKILYILKIVK